MILTNMNKEEMRQKLGNIAQIRELLFGEQIEEYDRQFVRSQKQIQQLELDLETLNSNLERFKTDIEENLSQLKHSLSEEINLAVDSVEKKLKYLSVNTYNEIGKVSQEIDAKTQKNFQKIELATDRLNSQIRHLQDEASYSKETIEKDIVSLKQQLSETIEKNLSELTEAKVSRSDLAEVLFELCLKIKGQDANHNTIEPSSNGKIGGRDGELLLLEETNSQV